MTLSEVLAAALTCDLLAVSGTSGLAFRKAARRASTLLHPCRQTCKQRPVFGHDAHSRLRLGISSSQTDRRRANAARRNTSSKSLRHLHARVHERTDALPLPHLIILRKMPVKMRLQLLIANESLAAVRALELNALIQLSDRHEIEGVQ